MTRDAGSGPDAVAGPSVVILADDLIWASRLSDAVTAAGGVPRRTRRIADLEAGVASGTPFALVDLTALGYDGVAAVRAAREAGARVIAVGQHDDVDLRKRAIAAGAERVFAYRKLFEDGPAVLRVLLAAPPRSGAHL